MLSRGLEQGRHLLTTQQQQNTLAEHMEIMDEDEVSHGKESVSKLSFIKQKMSMV